MAINRLRALKEDPEEGYEEPILGNNDGIDCGRAVFLQSPTSSDGSVSMARDGSDNLVFADGAAPFSRKLVDQLLEGETISSVGSVTTYAKTGSQVTNETVIISASSKVLRTIDYAYADGKVAAETVKVYGADGLTIVGEVVRSYGYATNPPTITTTRPV